MAGFQEGLTMPSLSELEARYSAFHADDYHYLADLSRNPEEWQAEQGGRRA